MTINAYQQNLFNDLETLIVINEAFYRQEFIKDDKIYWIYNYRLASYTDFLSPGAIEARGIMYEVNDQGEAVRLASWPMHKFFNRFENPLTTNVELLDIDGIEVKSDGSLISTYLHNDELFLKTKGSLVSDQAVAAMQWLNQKENYHLKHKLKNYAWYNYTVNLEWVSPENRIVLGYQEPRLIVLNVRDMLNGTYKSYHPELDDYKSPTVNTGGLSVRSFVENIPDMLDDIEGFVVKMRSGLWMKIKTTKYLSLHKCKDSVNNPRRLFEAIVNEGVDDIRSIFHEDTWLMNQIDEMQQKVDHIFNHMVKTVEDFYEANKHLDRKDFAIKAQSDIESLYFGLVMQVYQGKPANYKEFVLKSYKKFGIKDENLEENGCCNISEIKV